MSTTSTTKITDAQILATIQSSKNGRGPSHDALLLAADPERVAAMMLVFDAAERGISVDAMKAERAAQAAAIAELRAAEEATLQARRRQRQQAQSKPMVARLAAAFAAVLSF